MDKDNIYKIINELHKKFVNYYYENNSEVTFKEEILIREIFNFIKQNI